MCEDQSRTSLAQAAVAAAYEAAAQVAIDRKGFGSDAALVHPYDKGYVAACDAITTAIRALATPDQIAALAAERAATVTVKPLAWVGVEGGVGFHAKGFNNIYLIKASSNGAIAWQHDHMGTWYDAGTLEAAKTAAQADHDARIRSAITITSGASPNHIPLPRAEVEALIKCGMYLAWAQANEHMKVEFCYEAWDAMRKALATLQERMK